MSQQPALIAPQWTREPMFFLEVKVYTLLRVVSTPNSWSTVGHAGFIMDNLIASGKAKPMTWSYLSRTYAAGFPLGLTAGHIRLRERFWAPTSTAGLSMGGMHT